MPQPGCQPCFFGDSSEQSNHNPIVLAFVIKHEATGTCRLLCGGTGRKPICVRGEAVAALGGGHRRGSTGRSTHPDRDISQGQPRSPIPSALPNTVGAPGKG